MGIRGSNCDSTIIRIIKDCIDCILSAFTAICEIFDEIISRIDKIRKKR